MLLTNHCKHALLHIIPQINWELKTRVCIDWLYKDIDCNYFGALLQRTLKNYGAFFIILNKPNWKYKISWCVGTSPSSARGSLLGLRWVANSAEKYSTSAHLINSCVLLSIFHSRSGTVEGGLDILKTLSIVKTKRHYLQYFQKFIKNKLICTGWHFMSFLRLLNKDVEIWPCGHNKCCACTIKQQH